MRDVFLIQTLQEHLAAALGRSAEIVSFERGGGGCINCGAKIQLANGDRYFVKFKDRAPQDMFEREAEGLAALQQATTLRVPTPITFFGGDKKTPAFLVLEDITVPRSKTTSPRKQKRSFDELLADGLAELHRTVGPAYGFSKNNYIGSTLQPNTWSENWTDFFREQRLGHMIELLRQQGRLRGELLSEALKFLERVDNILEGAEAQPSLLHGDLWGGNVMRDGEGSPALIDPAVYFGHREADLAMTRLFGGFSPRFYAAYEEIFPLEEGFERRFDLYNLYHILNHAVLFGGGYLSEALTLMRRLSR